MACTYCALQRKKVRILQTLRADVVPSRRSLRKTEESSKLWEQLLLLSHNDIYTLHIQLYISTLYSLFYLSFVVVVYSRIILKNIFFRLLSAVCRGRKSKEKWVRRNKGVSIRNFFSVLQYKLCIKKQTKNYNTILKI